MVAGELFVIPGYIAIFALFRFKLGVIQTMGCSAALGVLYHLICWMSA